MFRRLIWHVFVWSLFAVFLSSCQKDDSVSDLKLASQTSADTTQKIVLSGSSGNYLVNKGTLVVKLADTSYSFDALQDSIAFVNLTIEGKAYFGITAINKAHTVSFGISTAGGPIAGKPGSISGCQLLLHPTETSNTAFTLRPNATPVDFGVLSLEKYNQDTILAKGTFHTYLSSDPKNTTVTNAVGTFELKIK